MIVLCILQMSQVVFTATFYHVNFAGNNNNCQIKGLQEIIKIAIFISDFNKKNGHLSTYCVIKTK